MRIGSAPGGTRIELTMPDSTKPSPTRVWLLRHGEPQESVRGRCYGSLDIELSPEGMRQFESAAALLSREPLAAIYTSPRLRCSQSAKILAAAHRCPIETVDELSEIHFGDFEGLTYDRIETLYPSLYRTWMERPTEMQFPGGESFTEMWYRVTQAASAIRNRHEGQSIALVTHGGVIRILIAEALAIPRNHIFRIAQRHAAVNLISYIDRFPIVELLNATAALE